MGSLYDGSYHSHMVVCKDHASTLARRVVGAPRGCHRHDPLANVLVWREDTARILLPLSMTKLTYAEVDRKQPTSKV